MAYYNVVDGHLERCPQNPVYKGFVHFNGCENKKICKALGYTMAEADAAAWREAHPAPVVTVVHRYSKLKLLDAIGYEAWMEIYSSLTTEQQTRLALAQDLATDDVQFSAALELLKANLPNAEEILESAEV